MGTLAPDVVASMFMAGARPLLVAPGAAIGAFIAGRPRGCDCSAALFAAGGRLGLLPGGAAMIAPLCVCWGLPARPGGAAMIAAPGACRGNIDCCVD
jgi:hypothetical protein